MNDTSLRLIHLSGIAIWIDNSKVTKMSADLTHFTTNKISMKQSLTEKKYSTLYIDENS